MDEIYKNSILIIGGMGIGKSTISKLLSDKIKLPIISTDAFKDEYLDNIKEYSFDKELEIRNNYGFKKEAEYLIPFLNMSFEYLLDNLKEPSIIDVGGLNTYKINDNLINKISKFNNIILLTTENVEELLNRRGFKVDTEIADIYINTLKNKLNYNLTNKIVNVDNKTPEDITDEIINIILKKNYAIK